MISELILSTVFVLSSRGGVVTNQRKIKTKPEGRLPVCVRACWWIFTDPHIFSPMPTDFHRFPRISTASHRFPLIFDGFSSRRPLPQEHMPLGLSRAVYLCKVGRERMKFSASSIKTHRKSMESVHGKQWNPWESVKICGHR